MSDRSEQLLSELVALAQRQLSNQETAIAEQAASVALQREAVERQRVALRRVWWLIAFIVLAIVAVPLIGLVFSIR